MRDTLILVSAALIAGVAATTVQAQQRPGWVDPPAKTESSKGEPRRPEAAKGEPAKTEPPKADAPATGIAAREPPAGQSSSEGMQAAGAGKARRAEKAERVAAGRRKVPAQAREPAVPQVEVADDPRFVGWAGQAQRLTFDYVDSISAPNAVTLAAAPRFYAARVRRFGKVEGLAAVIADKRRFGQRWPERRYTIRSGSTRTSCNAGLMSCIVRTTLDYRAQNPARGARSQGVAELVLEISFAGDRPLIVSESSRVLSRSISATLVDARTKPGA